MKFVFEVRVIPGHEKDYIAAWLRGSEIIQQQAGALGTELHRKVGEASTFLAIAQWESAEARQKAMQVL